MKVPNIFLPEKNLENKTERLLKEEPKPKTDEFKPAVEKSELEKVLELFDTSYSQTFSDEHLYANIDRLIEKSDYKPVFKRLKYKYWSRPSPDDLEESFVFVKELNANKDTYYSFAIVKNDKLKEFCKRFKKERSIAMGYQSVFAPLAKGSIIGGVLGLITDYAIAKFTGTGDMYANTGVVTLGMMIGFLYGALSIKYYHNRNRENLNKCYKCLMISSNTVSKDVLKAAFS